MHIRIEKPKYVENRRVYNPRAIANDAKQILQGDSHDFIVVTTMYDRPGNWTRAVELVGFFNRPPGNEVSLLQKLKVALENRLKGHRVTFCRTKEIFLEGVDLEGVGNESASVTH